MKYFICSFIICFLLWFGMGLFSDHVYEVVEPERVSWQIQEEKRLQGKYAAVDREWLYARPFYKEVPDVYIYPQNSTCTASFLILQTH